MSESENKEREVVVIAINVNVAVKQAVTIYKALSWSAWDIYNKGKEAKRVGDDETARRMKGAFYRWIKPCDEIRQQITNIFGQEEANRLLGPDNRKVREEQPVKVDA
ncbi:MAG: hypothetical protein AABY32_01930 [Nanoarchaeota archaeon]